VHVCQREISQRGQIERGGRRERERGMGIEGEARRGEEEEGKRRGEERKETERENKDAMGRDEAATHLLAGLPFGFQNGREEGTEGTK
jgi:hypothetical protein